MITLEEIRNSKQIKLVKRFSAEKTFTWIVDVRPNNCIRFYPWPDRKGWVDEKIGDYLFDEYEVIEIIK